MPGEVHGEDVASPRHKVGKWGPWRPSDHCKAAGCGWGFLSRELARADFEKIEKMYVVGYLISEHISLSVISVKNK